MHETESRSSEGTGTLACQSGGHGIRGVAKRGSVCATFLMLRRRGTTNSGPLLVPEALVTLVREMDFSVRQIR